MVKSSPKILNSKLAHKFTLWVIILSSVFTFFATAFHLYLNYQNDLKNIEEYCNTISSMQLKSISKSVWVMDESLILAQLAGMIEGKDIVYAAIFVDNIPKWESGSFDEGKFVSFNYPLHISRRNGIEQIGILQIVVDLQNAYDRLIKDAGIFLLTNGCTIFIFAGLVLLLFQFSVTKHLEKLASHVVRMDFRKKILPLNLDRKDPHTRDEFSLVVDILNMMQRRGYHTFNSLEKSENRLRLFFDSTEEGILGIDLERNFTFANRSCLKMLGCEDMTELIGRNIHKVVRFSGSVKDQQTQGDCLVCRSMEEEKTMLLDEAIVTLVNGTNFYASVRSYPIIFEGKCSGAIVFFMDISEQRELLREKNLLRQAIRHLPVMIIVSDEKGNIEYVNPGFEEISGYSLKEIIGKKPYFMGGYEANKLAYKGMKSTILRGGKWQGRYHHRTKDGALIYLDTVVSSVTDESGKIVNLIAVCLDVTQKVELQNQLNNAQKMEAVGRLSASFAHEFGNPLMGVRSVIGDIRQREELNNDDKHLLDLAYGECDRMKVLIRNFQQFHRNVSVEKEKSDLHFILDNVLFFYRKRLESHDVKLQKQYDENLPKVMVKKDQIAQVFLNLIINGVDAMSLSGGTLTISTRVVGEYAVIEVSDSGIGIRDEEKELIFEPFFTTKPEVEGTGMGLPVSYGIVASHGGDIKMYSELGKGTTFTVSLPI